MIEVNLLPREDGQIAVNVFDKYDLNVGYPMSECIIELLTIGELNEALDFKKDVENDNLEGDWDYERNRDRYIIK